MLVVIGRGIEYKIREVMSQLNRTLVIKSIFCMPKGRDSKSININMKLVTLYCDKSLNTR